MRNGAKVNRDPFVGSLMTVRQCDSAAVSRFLQPPRIISSYPLSFIPLPFLFLWVRNLGVHLFRLRSVRLDLGSLRFATTLTFCSASLTPQESMSVERLSALRFGCFRTRVPSFGTRAPARRAAEGPKPRRCSISAGEGFELDLGGCGAQ